MKKIFLYIILFFILLSAFIFIQNYPASSQSKNLERLSDTSAIREDLITIIHTDKPRNYLNTGILDSVATYIQQVFLENTGRVQVQEFEAYNRHYKNIIARFGPEKGKRIIVGAHYDVAGDQEGADDNASGVAGLLALSRLLKDKPLAYPVELVAYSLEEPPFFGTENMGSYIHARSLHDAGVPVKGMISLEMIGYFSDQPHSQDYPVGLLKWFYGNKGNYITIIQKPFNGSFSREFKKLAFRNNSILTKSFKAPSFFGGIDLSDHRNYWKFGYSSVMITNTSFYRNKNYHTKEDVIENLDIAKIGLVIDGLYRSLTEMK